MNIRLAVSEFTPDDDGFVQALYKDPEVCRQMYPSAPDESFEGTFIVRNDVGIRVGVFNLYEVEDGLGSFGFAVDPSYRGLGYGTAIVEEVKKKAREMGLTSLRADIYKDNVASIRACERAGLREFIWLEMNL